MEGAEWDFESVQKTSESGYRTAPVGDTLAMLKGVAARIPITRVSDLTPLDRLRLPVFSATTPLARDLTTHLGKGLDAESAQVSAMMEAVERISAERVECRTRERSFRQMAEEVPLVIDPRVFDLQDDAEYSDQRTISWIEGRDLVSRETVWLPLDIAISPPREGVLRQADTNGLAAGNSLLEAVVHALCEVIERDALGLGLFRSLFLDPDGYSSDGCRIAHRGLDSRCELWLERIAASGLDLTTELLDSDIGVPVFRSRLIDHSYPGPEGATTRTFVGLGASPNAAAAAARSIAEAVQSRIAIVQGARDSFNTLSPPWRPSSPRRELSAFEPWGEAPLGSVATFATLDLVEDLQYLLHRLTEAGFQQVIAINLTRPEFGVPVVRVRVPGLTSFAVDRRRPGWRCLRYLL